MRQPFCGLLLAVAIACPMVPSQACTPVAATKAPRGAPCTSATTEHSGEDAACCNAPSYEAATSAKRSAPAFRAADFSTATAPRNERLAK
jgi:hypothetical protein